MTTIAANLKCMAADSMCSDGFGDFPVLKLRTAGESVFGGCGTMIGMTKFFSWVERRNKKPPKHEKEETFQVLELNKRGLFLWENAYVAYHIPREYHAVGAGGQAAIALMMKEGYAPEQAVDASCDVVPSACARPVHVVRLADLKKPRKRK